MGDLTPRLRAGRCLEEPRIPQSFCADNNFRAVKEYHRRSREFAFLIGQGDRLAVLVEIREARIGCSKVDSNRVRLKHVAASSLGREVRTELEI